MREIQKSKKPNPDNTVTGLLFGIIVPVISFFIIYIILSGDLSIGDYLERIIFRKIQGHFISISVIPNLLVFFIFIWLYKMKAARGVLISTFLWAFIILAIRLFG